MVYLIHFLERINPGHPCQHYIGWTDNLLGRIFDHHNGKGSRLTQVAYERDIQFKVVRAWEGSRVDERRLKNIKNAPRFCPVCNPGKAAHPGLTEIDLIGDENPFLE